MVRVLVDPEPIAEKKKALGGNATPMHLEGKRKPKYPEETPAENKDHT